MYDYVIVGAGFAGCVVAERLATQANKRILLVDKRNHIGGNAYDYYDDNGILVHKYGPHIFHTNSKYVVDYLSQFTEWRLYEHKVLASVEGQMVPVPINRTTLEKIFGLRLSNDEAFNLLNTLKVNVDNIRNSEDVIISKVGRELYDKFFKGYTKKQWDLFPEQLDSSVCARIPIRTNADDRYFTDKYQMMPLNGYTKMFERMISNKNISVLLQTDFQNLKDMFNFKKLIYTGTIDSYFSYKFGKLPYRSLEFEFEHIHSNRYQATGTINYPNSYDFTRITEFKFLTGQEHTGTTIVKEFSKSEGEPYYPIPTPENNDLYNKYKSEADKESNVIFLGRLGTYRYYNMDQVVAQAISEFKRLVNEDN